MKFLRSAVLTAIIMCSMLRVSADSIEVSGMVSGTWDVDTVNVTGNLQIREVESLHISPGVLVRFMGEYFLEVHGSLRAEGSEEYPVRFTMADTTGFHNDTLPGGGWKQIRIENINPAVDSTIFRYCRFEFGKAVAADSVYGYGGAVCVRNTDKVEIAHCSFENNYAFFNGGAVYLEESSIHIHHNSFLHNRCGQVFQYYGYGGGICTDRGEPLIERNHFYQNSSTGIAGGLCVRFSDCPVMHNIFDNNFSALGGGFGILHIDSCRHVISNNLVINNGSAFFGAGISNNDCSPTYVNNTIANNHCQGGGGGFYCKDSVVPKLYNNILYGNTQYGGEVNQVYLWDLLSQPDFYYNNIQGGTANFAGTGGSAFSGNYISNLDDDPLFANGSYNLSDASPCIDAGTPDTTGLMIPETDLAGNSRLMGSTVDLGSYENQNPVGIKKHTIESGPVLYPVAPNPASGEVKITFVLKEETEVTLMIIDQAGRIISILCRENKEQGKHEVIWKTEEIKSGIYFCVINSKTKQTETKIIIQN